ncbi:MAG: acyltransferase family protein [Lachnospiraceae bacterium]|nr:acyltransferase family protein [Lachnospiraceae bacterium]
MPGKPNTERDFGADIVRITAGLLVLTVHFFLRNGFYYREADSLWGILAVAMRTFSFSCVPLFMMLTGYLKCGKTWTKRYYLSLVPILISYTLISLIHLLYKVLYEDVRMPVWQWIEEYLSFQLANYSWYVGMYVGLFLFSPLLNLIWSGCRTKKQHTAVVLTMLSLTLLPASVNSIVNCGCDLLPAYFTQIYYVAYYFMGCYIRTYQPKIHPGLSLFAAAALCILTAVLNVVTRTEPSNFYSGFSCSYGTVPTALITVFIFLSLYRISSSHIKVRKTAAFFSGRIFEVYLLSYLFDQHIYVLHYKEYPMSLYLPVGLLMVSAVFLLSCAAAVPVKKLSETIYRRLVHRHDRNC